MMRNRIYINNEWFYCEEFQEELITKDYDDSNLEVVRLPHTVAETPYNYFDESVYQKLSGYRRKLFVSKDWASKTIIITFEGVAHKSALYVNGEFVKEHNCGYTAFSADISKYLLYDQENLITVKVDSRENLNVPPFGYVIDYMTYGGIYRDVYLEIIENVNIQDVFCYCSMEDEDISKEKGIVKKVTFYSNVDISGKDESTNLTIKQFLYDGDVQVKALIDNLPISQKEGLYQTLQNQLEISEVELWSTEHPKLYQVKTILYNNGEEIDEHIFSFGFRKAVFKQDGFYLNGEKFKIRGLNRHQSYPYVGYAMPKSMQVLDADLLKNELGVNAVRTSHYPQSHYFLNRCDEIGLLVFTEIPGWQHIGDEEWKNQAVQNTEDMIKQYRNHTSIILWGVRINESVDDDTFYKRTNEVAHRLDPYRQTGGVRAHKKSSLLEDVYTYNDFVHDGNAKGCEDKKAVTSDMTKGYLVSEYNGHMFPTKNFDTEEHMREHALRHANVLNCVASKDDIAGSFGWCMFDYNTHKDFGSGDRICYHGVMDMFRNRKPAGYVYASQQEKDSVLSISSSFDIGEHPACNRGKTWIYSNADSVKMYKNGQFIKEYFSKDSEYRYLKHGPILIDDFIGSAIEKNEKFTAKQSAQIKKALNATAIYGLSNLPKAIYLIAVKMILFYHMKFTDAVALFNKYIGDWGGTSKNYKFEAVKDGKVVETVLKEPVHDLHLSCEADHTVLTEENTYDVSAIRIQVRDQNQNIVPFFQECIELTAVGDIEIIGPSIISLKGGMGGTYVKTLGKSGTGKIILKNVQAGICEIPFEIKIK